MKAQLWIMTAVVAGTAACAEPVQNEVQLELVGVGPARVVVEHDGHVLRSAFVDLSAEQELRVTL